MSVSGVSPVVSNGLTELDKYHVIRDGIQILHTQIILLHSWDLLKAK